MSTSVAEDFDPTEPETLESAHALYAHLRAECPVARSNAWDGFWALMAYEDVRDAASNPKLFTTTVQNVVPRVAPTGRRAPLHLDPPEHTPYRKVLNSLLTAEKVEQLEPAIRAFAIELLEPIIERGTADICRDFSAVLPLKVFGDWMQLPAEWLARLHELAMAFNSSVRAADPDAMRETSFALYDLARALVDDRVKGPRDPAFDPASALLAATIDGEPLPYEMVVGCVRQVLVVGLVAPMVLVGSIVVHLSRDVELQQRLRAQRELVPQAVEEFLRLYTPYRGFARTATEPVTLNGRDIRPDEPIALVFSSANRDETVFPEPDRFILNRPNLSQHLAFGRGPHNCPGAMLARAELTIALTELLARTRHFEITSEPVLTSFPEMGVISVEVRLER